MVDFRESIPQFDAPANSIVYVQVVDDRPYVLDHSKDANYVGNNRALFYNPYQLRTESGESLAKDLQLAIVDGLRESGINAESAGDVNLYDSNQVQRNLLITLKDWRTDRYRFRPVRFDYNLLATVTAPNGAELATGQVKGQEAIEHPVNAGATVLKELLTQPSVLAALRGESVSQDQAAKDFDDCMSRAIRVNDSQLRQAAIRACDSQ